MHYKILHVSCLEHADILGIANLANRTKRAKCSKIEHLKMALRSLIYKKWNSFGQCKILTDNHLQNLNVLSSQTGNTAGAKKQNK